MNRLVLIDGHAVLHRAFHALPPLTSRDGHLVNAVYGFVLMLLKVIEDLKPDYLAVAFDLPVPTFRHETYMAYQATRPHMDDGLKGQIEIVKEVVESAGIPIFSSPGFEADDVIATLAKQAICLPSTDYSEKAVVGSRKSVDEVIIVTGDKDILQLVDDKVKIYMLMRGMTDAKVFDKEAVEKYLGIPPEQIVDYKALIGDSSDNYPGVPGIGPKTAVELLKKFENLDEIYKAVKEKEIPGNVGNKLADGHESALISQKLAKISVDAPIEMDLEKAILKDLKTNDKFVEKLQELGFKSLVGRMKGTKDKGKGDGGQTRLF